MDLPPAGGWHAFVAHFPIALLLAAPLLVLLAPLSGSLRRGVALAALGVMAAGATGAVLAVPTGEEAARIAADTGPGVLAAEAIAGHRAAGGHARNAALVLVVLYGVLQAVPVIRKREFAPKADWILHGLFLLLYAGGVLLVLDAADSGHRLVHDRGIRAPVGEPRTGR